MYVARFFPPDYKAKMDELVANLVAAMRQRLPTLAWMDDATRAEAAKKLATFDPRVGYPVKWRDYSAYTVERGKLFENVRNGTRFDWNRRVARLDEPVDRVLARAREAGVTRVVAVGSGLESCRRTLAIAEREEGVYAALGLHPPQAGEVDDRALDELRELRDDEREAALPQLARELSPELEAVLVGSLVRDDKLEGVLVKSAPPAGEDDEDDEDDEDEDDDTATDEVAEGTEDST